MADPRQSQDALWSAIRAEAEANARAEPVLASFYHSNILNHRRLEDAVAFHLASKLDCADLAAMSVREVFEQAFAADPGISLAMRADIAAVKERDAACEGYSIPVLFFKGFQALQSYRIAHWLWGQGRKPLALFLQHRVSGLFDVDIHPAAVIGCGVLLDHGTGIVIGETAVVGDNVSMLHGVTLGGSGRSGGVRHPQVGAGVLIAAGAKVLGNVRLGEGAKIGAGSLVLEDVAPHTTVAGVPARPVGRPRSEQPALDMNHQLGEAG